MTKNISVGNKSVVYHVAGNGNALVLIHGFGFDSRAWDPMLPALKKKSKVIRVELPGFGGSDLPDGEPSIDVYADSIAAVMKNENVISCPVVGHSMGGYVALNLLERHNALVEALGLFHSQPFADDDAKKEKRLKDADFIERNGSAQFIHVLIPALFSDLFKQKNAATVNGLVEQFKSLNANGLVYALKAMRSRPDRSEGLKKLKSPLLQIVGMKDGAVPPESSFKTCGLVENSETLTLRDVGHLAMYESTERSSKHIISWLSGIR